MPNRIAQIGGTVGRAFMRDRDRRRREKVEDYAYDSRVARDEAEKAAMQKQEQIAPLVSSYVQALQTGDKEQASMAYNNLVTRLEDPEQMAKFSQMHQQFLQRVDQKNKGLSDAKYRAGNDARGRGLKISGYDEFGNPTGYIPMGEEELSPTERAELEYRRSLAKRYISGNKKEYPASGMQSPQIPKSDPVSNQSRIQVRKDAAKEYRDLKNERDPSVDNVSQEEYIDNYERIVTGKANKPSADVVKFEPYGSAVQSAPNRISSANISVDVPSAPQESTRVAPAQSEVGTGNKGSVPPEVKQELMQIAQDIKTQKQDPRTIEEIYQEELANWLSAQGK